MQRPGGVHMPRLRRRVVLAAVVLALAGSVVLAHSAMAADHMGSALAVCIAVAETAGLAVLARTTTNVGAGTLGIRLPNPPDCGALGAPARPVVPPWPGGQPVCVAGLAVVMTVGNPT